MKEIQLTNGKVSLVDDVDFEYLRQWKWKMNSQGYAERTSERVLMHRIIMSAESFDLVDHKDHDRLNNQRSNLRICNRAQNKMNSEKTLVQTSKYKGVCIHFYKGKPRYYKTQLSIDGSRFCKVFPFSSDGELQAAALYNELAKRHYGEFAHLNDLKVA